MRRKKHNKTEKADNSKVTYIFTRETLGMTLLLFSALVFLMLFTGSAVFAGIGRSICVFLYGTFGYGALPLMAMIAYIGEWLLFEKHVKIPLKTTILICVTTFFAFLLFHAATSRNIALDSYGGYVEQCYKSAMNGFSGYTFGGVICAAIVYPVAKFATFVGSYIIFALFVVLGGYFLFLDVKKRKRRVKVEINEDETDEVETLIVRRVNDDSEAEARSSHKDENVQADEIKRSGETNSSPATSFGNQIIFKQGEFTAEIFQKNGIFNEKSYFNRPTTATSGQRSSANGTSGDNASTFEKTYEASFQEDTFNKVGTSTPSHYVYGDKPIDSLYDYGQVGATFLSRSQNTVVTDSDEAEEEFMREESDDAEMVDFTSTDSVSAQKFAVNEEMGNEDIQDDIADTDDSEQHSTYGLFGVERVEKAESTAKMPSRWGEFSNANIFSDSDVDDDDAFNKSGRLRSGPSDADKADRLREIKVNRAPTPITQTTERASEDKPKHVWKKYIRPNIDLLDDYPEHNNVNTGEIEDNKRIIVDTLFKFKIESDISNVIIGPAVTRYDVIIEDKTKSTQSLKYKEAIAMALKKDNVTAYLNYSKGALSIEVPNNVRTIVGLKGMLASKSFINSKPNSITFALGKNVEGEEKCVDITKMPHLLIAGTSGSGKSICLSALIISLLYKYGPEELRFILVDPKQVEFISYDKLPHLMINEIIYDVNKAVKALNWAIKEMERRYSLFKEMTERGIATKNLDEYNAHIPAGEEKLPKIVIILDEFGDLMLQAKKDIEGRIIKLVQKARACGIHLILATQRPSVDCITGLIKSNLPTRIGFKVSSQEDSRTIFDFGGAEKLLGKGDLYFRSAESPDLLRIQGCFIDTHEVQRVTDFIKANNETYFDQDVCDFINTVEAEEQSASGVSSEENGGDGSDIKDDTYLKALYYCITSNQASVSMIQRRFPIGYMKACKIIDWMAAMNYVTQAEGAKPRKVLFSKEDFLKTYGEIDD